jgi:type I restriction enzyme S subunit
MTMTDQNENGRWPLPEGWEYARLRDVAEINYGKGLTVSQRDETGSVPVYGSSGVVGFHTESIAPGPSLIIGRKGAAGAVHYSPVDSWPIDTAYYLRFPEQVSTKYAYYALQTLELSSLDRSTAIPSLSRDDLYAQAIPLAPLPTQHLIVAEIEKQFTRLDAAVAALRRAKANLARYKAAVLKAAVEGRLVAQDPDDEPAGVLLERILAERRAQWQAANPKKKYVEPKGPDVAGLGELPVGWVWATVEQITSLIQYGHTTSAVYEPVGPKFLRITDIQDGFVDWDAVPWCHCTQEEYEKYRVSSGDIVFARTGATTGKSYLIKDCPNTVFASYLIRLQLTKPFDQRYLAYYFDSPFYWSRITSEQKGSAQPGVNATILSTLEVPVPPLAEQSRIVNEVERCLSVIHASDQIIDANLARAERLRQGVLGRAFRGELVGQLSSTDNALLK